MHTLSRTPACALALMAFASAAPAATLFDIRLDSAQEVPPAGVQDVPETGFGRAKIVREDGALGLSYSVFFDDDFAFAPILGDPAFPYRLPSGSVGAIDARTGLDVTRLHIHNGARGANGPVVYGIVNPSSEQDRDAFVDTFAGASQVFGTWDFEEGQGGATFEDFLPGLLALSEGEDAPLYFNLHTADDPAGAIRGQLVAANGVNDAAQIAPVPVPAALPLLALGLAGLGMVGRRAKRTG